MSDSYQAIYDAVRSKISGGDIAGAVESVARDAFDMRFAKERIISFAQEQMDEWGRPCVVFRPALSRDGNMWCALLGENLQVGLAGFGETPAKAMAAFDLAFYKESAK